MSEGMVCSQCGEELPTATRRTETAGGLTYFAGNRFCHSHLTKEAAQLRRSKATDPKEKRGDADRLAAAVLAIASAPEDEEARTSAREQLVSVLSQIATSGKSAASVAALSALASRAGEILSGSSKVRPPLPNEICQVCGREPNASHVIRVSDELMRSWAQRSLDAAAKGYPTSAAQLAEDRFITEHVPGPQLGKPYPYMDHDDGEEDGQEPLPDEDDEPMVAIED